MSYFKFGQINLSTRGKFVPPDLDFDGLPVTPNDGADLPNGATYAIAVTGSGNVAGVIAGGSGTTTLAGLVPGIIYIVAMQRVNATGTTATGVYALY